MKKLSIRARVAVWYTGFLVILMVAGAVYLLSFSSQISMKRQKELLMDVVTDAVAAAAFDRGKLEDDRIDFYKNGVSVFLYDTEGQLLEPRLNSGIELDSVLEDRHVRTIVTGREYWLVYDLYAVQDETGFWVRGALELSETRENLVRMILLAVIAIPGFAAVAVVGGYLITKRAFAPVGKMAETAAAITSGSDLSRRLPDDGSGDELSRLGQVFNSMLERLQRSFEEERQFTSDVSHELRTPTAVIISQCEYALSGQSEKEHRAAFLSIHRQAKRISSIIAQLLMLSRAENGKFTPKFEKINLGELCEMVVMEMEEEAERAQVRLNMDLQDGAVVEGDETLLIRMIGNLLSNAIGYNRQGGTVAVKLRKEPGSCIVEIKDTGTGIREEDLPRIWNRFFRADPSRTGEGTGLGLSMVRWIAQTHGGAVRAESIYGSGSCFRVILPERQN